MADAPEPRKLRIIPYAPQASRASTVPEQQPVAAAPMHTVASPEADWEASVVGKHGGETAGAVVSCANGEDLLEDRSPTERRRPHVKGEPYEVGYGKPPKANQFPNKTANTRGRPKGSVSLTAELRRLLSRRIAVTESGKRVKKPYIEVLVTKTGNDALLKQGRAADQIYRLIEKLLPAEVPTTDHGQTAAEDAALFAKFRADLAKERKS